MKYFLHFRHLHIANFKVPTELYVWWGEVAVPSVATSLYFLSESPSLNISQSAPQMSPPPWSFSFLIIITIITTDGVNLLCAPSTFRLFLWGELYTESSHFLETALKCPWVPLWIRLFLFSLQWRDWGKGTCNRNRFRSSCMLHSPLLLWLRSYFPFPWRWSIGLRRHWGRAFVECARAAGRGKVLAGCPSFSRTLKAAGIRARFHWSPPPPRFARARDPGTPYLLWSASGAPQPAPTPPVLSRAPPGGLWAVLVHRPQSRGGFTVLKEEILYWPDWRTFRKGKVPRSLYSLPPSRWRPLLSLLCLWWRSLFTYQGMWGKTFTDLVSFQKLPHKISRENLNCGISYKENLRFLLVALWS